LVARVFVHEIAIFYLKIAPVDQYLYFLTWHFAPMAKICVDLWKFKNLFSIHHGFSLSNFFLSYSS